MELLVIRHAIAEDRERWAQSGEPDEHRPLTADGIRKMRRNVRGLARIAGRPDVLAASPLVRAAQTAEIVARAWEGLVPETVPALSPEGRRTAVLSWLRGLQGAETVAVVGHEPSLGQLVTWLLTGLVDSRIEIRKGAACLVRFDAKPASGRGMLVWSLAPGQLRKIAK
jgi:phosphohistidine phosphatase